MRQSLALLASTFLFACAASDTTPGNDPPDPGAADAGATPDSRPDDTPPAPDAAVPQGTPIADCFAADFVNPPTIGPDYDQFGAAPGSHCRGTNHQDITGIERVVFLGDSVTVGTPPTVSGDFYRAQLAGQLADRFDLQAPDFLWESVNIFDGTSMSRESGDFASCAKWGARTDDLIRDNTQVQDCFPVDQRQKRTLVIMTIGGNDVAKITQAGIDGVPITEIWDMTEEFVQLNREALEWFKEPGRFPNGVFVVFANMFEFTDGTGDVTACPAAGLAGFGAEWDDPDALADMVIWANEQYMAAAVDTGSDMIFALENFCGHGFNHTDPSSPCYRGPDAERWFDDTCIHPNPTGHGVLADMFMAVVDE